MKKLWIAILSVLSFVCMMFGIACQPNLAFNEGYLEEITLGEPIMLDEYVDPSLTDDYTLILTHDETGTQRDLKMLGQWTTDVPGTYTLTYTVNSGEHKGTISTKIEVVVADARWQYSTPTLVYRVGESMSFNALKRNLNIVVKSYYGYDFFVESIKVNGEVKSLANTSSYTFADEGEHIITFGVETEDGQVLKAEQKISVRSQQLLAEGAAEWMEENGMTAYDYTLISPDGKVSLDAGYYSTFTKDNVPYFAFNGKDGEGYGANTYMMVDFTGKNLPQVAFFCDEVTPSFTDKKNGILFSNGTSYNNGSFLSALDASRLTVFGPYKVEYAEFDNKGRMLSNGTVAAPNPLSYNALQEDCSYRYIIGITEANTTAVTARILLINMTTGERVCDQTYRMTSTSGKGVAFKDMKDDKWNADYFKGSIALYGRYGIKLEFDKVYMPITGIKDIYELDQAAEFKDNYKTQYDLNSTANVSDYIDIPDGDYEFTVIDPEGNTVDIDADGYFTYTKSGKYLLKFDPKQEGIRVSTISVRVMYDLHNPLPADFLELEGVLFSAGDSGIKTNKDVGFINEGNQSIHCYAMNGAKDGKLSLYLSKSFMEFIFLSREVAGISFDVYLDRNVTYSLSGSNHVVNYTGEIAAETWTTLTITREMCMRNFDVYKSAAYSIGITMSPDATNPFLKQTGGIYVDNVKLITQEVAPVLSAGVQSFMEENNMTAHGYKAINDDLSVDLYEGMYQGEWYTIKNDDIPYIAYNGNYGAGSYVVVDFTGKNVPQFAFLVDRVTPSLTDGGKGLYVHTGMLKKTGALVSDTDGGRITFFGPNKMEYCRPDAEGRVGLQYGAKAWDPTGKVKDENGVPSPLSIRGLQDGVHYRYVAGIKAIAKESKYVISLELLLINLDTNEVVVKYDTGRNIQMSINYDSGNVAMYSRYNTGIKLDKIYPIYTNVSNINAIDKVAEILQ